MAWKPAANAPLGLPNVLPVNPDPAPPSGIMIGLIAPFVEDTQGPGQLIYLPGVAGLVAGDLVAYDLTPGAQAVVRAVTPAVSNSGRPVAVAISAPQAGQYAWFQISGVAIVNAIAGTAVGPAMGSATAGSVGSAAVAGSQILGSRILSAVGTPSAGKSYMMIDHCNMQGQIT